MHRANPVLHARDQVERARAHDRRRSPPPAMLTQRGLRDPADCALAIGTSRSQPSRQRRKDKASGMLRMRGCHAGCSPSPIPMSFREPTPLRFAQ